MSDALAHRKQVAETIVAQLGGQRRLNVMTGAHSFSHGDYAKEGEPSIPGLSFRIKAKAKRGIKSLIIKLNGSDLYDIEFGKIVSKKDPEWGFAIPEYVVVETASDIYADNLREVIERETGLYLSL